MDNKAVVLYIDDEYLNLSAFKMLFRKKFIIFTTHNPVSALDILRDNTIDVVIVDQRMPVMSGVELLKKIITIDSSCLRIIHSGYIDDPEIKKAIDEDIAHATLDKPLNQALMISMIDDHIKSRLNR